MPPKSYAYWEWRVSPKGNVFKPFDKEDSMQLEKQYRTLKSTTPKDSSPSSSSPSSGASTLQLIIGGKSYTLDVCGLTQTNDVTGTTREIRRVKPPSAAGTVAAASSSPAKKGVAEGEKKKPEGAACGDKGDTTNVTVAAANTHHPNPNSPPSATKHYAWQWLSHDKFVDYDPLVSMKIENAYVQDALVVDVGPIPISAHDTADVKIHFGYMHQINKDSEVTRKIRRVERDGPAPALFTKPPVTEPFNQNFDDDSEKDKDAGGDKNKMKATEAKTALVASETNDTQLDDDDSASHPPTSAGTVKLGAKRARSPC